MNESVSENHAMPSSNMANSVIEGKVRARRDIREEVLCWMYENANGLVFPAHFVDPDLIAAEMGKPMEEVGPEIVQLANEGLFKAVHARRGAPFLNGIVNVGITALGTSRAEETVVPTETPRDVPVTSNLIVIGNMTGSSIVQSSRDSIARPSEVDAGKHLVELMRELAKKVELEEDDAADLNAQLDTAETQMRAKRPSSAIIAGALNLAKDILVAAGGASILAALKSQFPEAFGTE